jgi:hypothetical protein
MPCRGEWRVGVRSRVTMRQRMQRRISQLLSSDPPLSSEIIHSHRTLIHAISLRALHALRALRSCLECDGPMQCSHLMQRMSRRK